MNFEEIIIHINAAMKFVETEVDEEFSVIVDNSYQTLEFVAGHVMGMRDAMIMVQNVLEKSLLGEEE
tara:strand:- start:683 stop:883 length:201 start_codon:yes stop_codon:yes gene_type:complete